MIRACATSRDVLVSSRNELGRPANDAAGIGRHRNDHCRAATRDPMGKFMAGGYCRTDDQPGHAVIANVLDEVQ